MGNDRPIFTGDPKALYGAARDSPSRRIDSESFHSAHDWPVGKPARNAPAPGQESFIFDLIYRPRLQITDKIKLRPVVEFDNVLNKTVFSFGSEFIDSASATSSAATKQAFLDSFLVATRTMRPRQIFASACVSIS